MAGKLAVVTGASSGIGYWLVKELAGRGCDIVICSARERLEEASADHVYAASFKTKLEGMVANVVPGKIKGAIHEKLARPLDEKSA